MTDNNKHDNNVKTLRIVEAFYDDVGKGIARIPSRIIDSMDIIPGDVIEIKGKNKTVAKVLRGTYEDEHDNIIRVDSIVRSNLGNSLSDDVEIKKIKVERAESVTLSPVEQISFRDDPSSFFHSKLLDKALIKGQKIVIDVMGNQLYYIVTKISPKGCARVVGDTKIIVSDKVVKADSMKVPEVSYEDIGGLKEEIDKIREMIEVPIKNPEVFQRLGISAPKGVLLTGPPGTGKTLLAKAVASETESEFYSIAGPEIMSKFYGESEKQLRDIFEEASKNSPSIIFIDEIDSIAPKRGEARDQTEKRVVTQLLTAMDGLSNRGNVVVIAATNRPDDIDEALRRPGRFDREIQINAPKQSGRLEILKIHSRGMPLSNDVDLDYISEKTIGFTGADIEVLCKEAALKAIKPWMPSLKTKNAKIPASVLEKIVVSMKDFKDALKIVDPSAMREVQIIKPKTKMSDIGGLDELKERLKEVIEWPLKDPGSFEKFGVTPSKGVLFYGPPGTGKTLLAKAIANESDANFIAVKGPELISKWVGESEKHIREIFKKARQLAPSIIFFDEFDSISKARSGGGCGTESTERMVNQLLNELDGIEELDGVAIIAATNRPDLIDPALLRSGRIDLKLEVPLPDEQTRKEIFRVHIKNMPLDKDVNIEDFVEKSKGFSGADIEGVTREAGMDAMREFKLGKNENSKVKAKHFEYGFRIIKEMKN